MKTYIDNYWCLQFVKHVFDSAICLSQLIRLTMFYCFFSYNKSERCFMEPFSQYFSRRLSVWVLLWSNAGKRQYQSNLSSWAILEIRLTHVIYCLLHHRFHCNTSLFTRNSLRTICLPVGVFLKSLKSNTWRNEIILRTSALITHWCYVLGSRWDKPEKFWGALCLDPCRFGMHNPFLAFAFWRENRWEYRFSVSLTS